LGSSFQRQGSQRSIDWQGASAPRILDNRQREVLRQVVEDGPTPAIHGVVRWRLIDLAQWVFEKFRVSISKQTLSRELRAMGFRKLSARPRHHAQDMEAVIAFKTYGPPRLQVILSRVPTHQSASTYPAFAAMPQAKMEIRAFRSS
jgi:transposase